MIQRLSEPVTVTFSTHPLFLTWKNRDYPLTQLGLHHTFRDGSTLHHVFSVAGDDLFFRLDLNSRTLRWTLEEVSDGLPD
ncbi:MAG: hypothetical protein UX38_C0005G0026 [Microgenomates group bacterium GW2011_GWC1_46_16]|jgi:hypothetical protein|uniref:Uncharacterized protein n=2 Tax=Candidatus Collieribacteriota TaxID=1752725 RepID=A0A1F5FYX8_9BACT|nr:MAG: hypothetical protein UX32_C0007G0007 [Microgenomates group bacterium GW2011_GWF1_46_12]KKU26523.1 MAG: hypothetical protein UX38_C0005G0026 [Microgenomates group bacterium GW2011_GWC1_46_16]KKU28214.1 MAG: hypothetical protein UX40_C0002G0054 [Microgenomates group bacterium GW2011_GWF2_46_18]KKU43575.1 MAG: hypothetical protein UX59_C0014G0007 [Microgenomates group bacterium GW2011_GWA1_46_7]KKU45135.1 MAG: hypothetical protein UX63_C0011G0007 [Microgenomates group bacterium GW2011_GWB1